MAETPPVNHARAVAKIENVIRVEAAVDEARRAVVRLCARERRDQRLGRVFQRMVSLLHDRRPFARALQQARCAKWRA